MKKDIDNDFFVDDYYEMEYEYLTPKEVMNCLGIGKNTFYKLVNSGRIPAFRIGRLWRVKREALSALFDHHSD